MRKEKTQFDCHRVDILMNFRHKKKVDIQSRYTHTAFILALKFFPFSFVYLNLQIEGICANGRVLLRRPLDSADAQSNHAEILEYQYTSPDIGL